MFFFMLVFGGGVYVQVKTFHVFGLFIMIFFCVSSHDYLCVLFLQLSLCC